MSPMPSYTSNDMRSPANEDDALVLDECYDEVNHPKYYTDGKIEVIDFIEDKGLGFCLGNVVKYVSRAGKKDAEAEIKDLKKAAWYLNRRIYELQEQKQPMN